MTKATLALLCLAVPLAAQQPERFALTGGNVAVYNLVGEMRVGAGTGRDVVAEVTRGGSDRQQLRIERGRVEGREALRVFVPGSDIVYPRMGRGSRSNIRVRDDGTFGGSGIRGGNPVTVQGTGRGVEAFADVRVLVPAGQQVTVHQGVGRVEVANVNGRLAVRTLSAAVSSSGTRGTLDIDVGSGAVRVDGADGPLKVDTGSGSVEVRAVRGDAELDTGSGSVRLADVRGGRLKVDTGSGGVTGGGLAVSDLEVDVGSGGVQLTDVRAPNAKVDTGSGSVRLDLIGEVRAVKIDTGSGGVTLGIPRNTGAMVEIDTGSGGIDVDLPARVTRSRRTHFSGQLGDGRGRIEIDTGSGSVRVRGT